MTVLTNSLPVMDLMAQSGAAHAELIGLGGWLRKQTRSFVGPATIAAIERHFADKLLFSVNGFASDGVLTEADPLEAEVKRAMVGPLRRGDPDAGRLEVRARRAERDHRPPRGRRGAGGGCDSRADGAAEERGRRAGGRGVTEPDAPIVELRDAAKSYGAVRALRDGNLALRPGEVRGLIGENGAGKSTLVKVLGGVVRRDAGEMLADGEVVDFHSPHDARDAGIAVIYQEPTLFPDLSIAENVVMGYHPRGSMGRIDRRAMHRQVQGLLDRLGVQLDSDRPVRGLSIADQQIVEIAKALSFDARVLIMDEPTAALSGPEVERLFAVVRTLQEHGAGVLFISHRLDEVFAICDTVTVMRDGAVVHDAPIAEMTPDDMVRRMVGRELGTLFPKQDAEIGAPVLRGPPAHPRGRVLRRQLRGPRGRDRRARRARRRRPQRGGARDLRDRPARRRPRRDGRRAAAGRPPACRRCGPASRSSPRTGASRGW